MKRFLTLLLLLPLLTLSSCGKPPALQTDFSASFTAQADELDCAGTVVKEGDRLTITINEPYTTKDMIFDYDDARLSVRYLGHSANAEADYLPANSVPASLRSALLYLTQANYTGSENGCDTYSVTTPYGEAALSAQDGYPTEITEPHSGITFRFDNAS